MLTLSYPVEFHELVWDYNLIVVIYRKNRADQNILPKYCKLQKKGRFLTSVATSFLFVLSIPMNPLITD